MVVASLPGISSMLMLMMASLILSAVVGAEDSGVRTVKRSIYRIHGLMPYPDDLFRRKFRATFEDHLNAEVAPLFSHGGERIRFEMGGQDFRTVFNSAENEDFDFIFTFPNMAGCLEAEFGASALLTMRNLRRGMELNMYGGVIFTRADRDDINSVHDLRDKRVDAVDILMMQHQWSVFKEQGMDMMNDVGQLHFSGKETNMLQAVLDGRADAGFHRTDTLEAWEEDPALAQYAGKFKILNPRQNVTVDGKPFPFKTSSRLYPESAIMAMPWVEHEINTAIVAALLKLTRSSNASVEGGYGSWQPALSYGAARDLYQELGLMKYSRKSERYKCVRATHDDYCGVITCGKGRWKKSNNDILNSCPNLGKQCPEGDICICKPCMAGQEVSMELRGVMLSCEKMERCKGLASQQGEEHTLTIRDNKLRDYENASLVIHDPVPRTLQATRVGESVYNVTFSINHVGTHVFQVFVGKRQAPDSPFMVEVTSKACSGGKVANVVGDCVCTNKYINTGETCVSLEWVVPAIVLPIMLTFVVCGYLLYRRKVERADQLWRIDAKDIKFASPPEVLGKGAFGVVVKASYFGTDVAVKAVTAADGHNASILLAQTSVGQQQQQKQQQKPVAAKPKTDVWEFLRLGSSDTKAESSAPSSDAYSESSTTAAPSEADPAKQALDSIRVKSQRAHVVHVGKLLGESSGDVGGVTGMTSALRSTIKSSQTQGGGYESRKGLPGALAVLSCGLFDLAASKRRKENKEFIDEMRMLSRLRHPCIISVMGAVIQPGKGAMLVMECMDHGSLYDLINNDTIVMEGEIVLSIMRDVMQGILYLHSNRPAIVHGDIKSANILVDVNFRAKVADFGLTTRGELGVSGTPYWMAPELLTGDTNTVESDVYAFGITLWEVYSREAPYSNTTPIRALEGVVSGMRPTIPVGTPECIHSMIERCWSQTASHRPDAQQLNDDLRQMESKNIRPPAQLMSLLRMSKDEADEHEADSQNSTRSPLTLSSSCDMMAGGQIEPRQHGDVSVLFAQVIGLPELVSTMEPHKISGMFHRLFSRFDKLAKEYNVFQVETISDRYMATTNVANEQPDHHVRLCKFALAILVSSSDLLIDEDDQSKGLVKIRIGMSSGPAVSNAMGNSGQRFCLFGDAINTASGMENTSLPGKIQVSKQMRDGITKARQASHVTLPFDILPRGHVRVKGKGKVKTFWIIQMGITNLIGHPAYEQNRASTSRDYSSSWDMNQLKEERRPSSCCSRQSQSQSDSGKRRTSMSGSRSSTGNNSLEFAKSDIAAIATLSPTGPRADSPLPVEDKKCRGSTDQPVSSQSSSLSSLNASISADELPEIKARRMCWKGFAGPVPMELTQAALGLGVQSAKHTGKIRQLEACDLPTSAGIRITSLATRPGVMPFEMDESQPGSLSILPTGSASQGGDKCEQEDQEEARASTKHARV